MEVKDGMIKWMFGIFRVHTGGYRVYYLTSHDRLCLTSCLLLQLGRRSTLMHHLSHCLGHHSYVVWIPLAHRDCSTASVAAE